VATVAERIAEAVVAAGARHVWGMPGGDTLPVVDAVEARELPFVLVRDEASAGFAAAAEAQLTGGLGACAATLGPGLTNLVSGMAGALLDRAPVLALTSRSRSDRHGTYTHMVLDQAGLMAASGKAVCRMTAQNAPGELRRAVAVARAPRPGPVWLEIPSEVGAARAGEGPLTPPPAPALRVGLDLTTLDRIAGWRRPAILVGHGGRHAPIAELARALRAPVLTTYKAKGALPEEDGGWWAGPAGLSPAVDRHHQHHLARCDGLVLVGWDPVELRDHWLPGWPAELPVVVLDDHVPTDLPTTIEALAVGPIHALVAEAAGLEGASTWTEAQVATWRAAWVAGFDDAEDGPATALRAVQAACPPDVVATLDTGAHRITASHTWRAVRPDRLLQSNGLASMGFAVPAALAAAALGHPAVAITGDMGLQLVMGELMVAAERGWPLTVVVLVDEELALIALKQKRSDLPARGVGFRNPDWPALGRAVGGTGVVARGPRAIHDAITTALARPTVDLVAIPIDPGPYLSQIG
jgi:acetolactate synthase I/II/III large subunit